MVGEGGADDEGFGKAFGEAEGGEAGSGGEEVRKCGGAGEAGNGADEGGGVGRQEASGGDADGEKAVIDADGGGPVGGEGDLEGLFGILGRDEANIGDSKIGGAGGTEVEVHAGEIELVIGADFGAGACGDVAGAGVDGENGVEEVGCRVEFVGDVAAEGDEANIAADEAVGCAAGTVEIDVANAFGEAFEADESGDGGGDAVERGEGLGVEGGEEGEEEYGTHGRGSHLHDTMMVRALPSKLSCRP